MIEVMIFLSVLTLVGVYNHFSSDESAKQYADSIIAATQSAYAPKSKKDSK